MEATRIVTCASLAWVAAYVGIGSLAGEAPGWQAWCGHVSHLAMRAARRVGGWRVSLAMLELGPFSSLCDHLVTWGARQNLLLSRSECSGGVLICVVLSALLCVLWSRSPLGMVAPLVAWCAGVPAWDASRRARRERELGAEMPGVFRTLAMALGSGETLAQAIGYVGDHQGGIVGPAFRNASMRLRCGMTVQQALGALVEELDAPGVSLLATALSISQRTGCPLRSLFQQSALLVERQGDFERLLSVKTAQVRLSAQIVSALPALLVAILSLISPDFQHGLMTVPGMVCVTVAALMDMAALLVIRRLMKGVL